MIVICRTLRIVYESRYVNTFARLRFLIMCIVASERLFLLHWKHGNALFAIQGYKRTHCIGFCL